MQYTRRFVFVHYDDLAGVQFKQLEKVTDKLFVFVPAGVTAVPMWLVRQTQDMGRDLAWVDVGGATYEEAQLAIGFHAGQLHTQTDPGVEFVMLSGAEGVEALVDFMQAAGREAVRARRRPQSGEGAPSGKTVSGAPASRDDDDDDDDEEDLDLEAGSGTETKEPSRSDSANGYAVTAQAAPTDGAVAAADTRAEDIVRDLIRAGQRPASLTKLRSYLLLYGADVADETDAEEVIGALAEKGEIAVSGERVVYRF